MLERIVGLVLALVIVTGTFAWFESTRSTDQPLAGATPVASTSSGFGTRSPELSRPAADVLEVAPRIPLRSQGINSEIPRVRVIDEADLFGDLKGEVLDYWGAPLPGHQLLLRSEGSEHTSREAFVDKDGKFEIDKIPVGIWQVFTLENALTDPDPVVTPQGEIAIRANRTEVLHLFWPGERELSGRFTFDLTELTLESPTSGIELRFEVRPVGAPQAVIARKSSFITERPLGTPTAAQKRARQEYLEKHGRVATDTKVVPPRPQVGEFRFSGLQVGNYTLRIVLVGSEKQQVTFKTTESGQSTTLELELFIERPVVLGNSPVVLPHERFGLKDFVDAALKRRLKNG